MKAYPEKLLKASLVLEKAQSIFSKQKTQNEPLNQAIQILNNKIYQPPFWIRFGLFIAAWLGGSFGMGWIWLLFFGFLNDVMSSEMSSLLMSIISAILAFAVAKHFIETKNHFCSGIDDAFAIICLFSLGVSAFQIRDMLNLPPLSWYSLLAASAVAGWFSYYYLDRFMAFIAICLLLFGLYKLVLITPLGMLMLPLLFLIVGIGLWFVNKNWQNQGNLFYESLVDFIEVCSLCLVVLSPQYILVNFAFQELMNASGPLPYGLAFQFFTLFIPLVMLTTGWLQKNRAMLWVGFLGLAFSFYFLGTVVWFMAPELCLLLIGSVFLGIGYILYKLLKSGKLKGFDMDADTKAHFLQDVVSQTLQTTMATERPEPKVEPKFGGGDFGGAGASSEF